MQASKKSHARRPVNERIQEEKINYAKRKCGKKKNKIQIFVPLTLSGYISLVTTHAVGL